MKPPGRRGLLAAGACALLLAAFYLAAALVTTPLAPYLLPPLALSLPCLPAVASPSGSGYAAPGAAALADAAVEYATSETVPQQSRDEIALSLAVLRRRAPLRLLVFGLGHDSRLWHALNPGGATVFLEEDPAWYRVVRAQSPFLRAHLVAYRTRLDQADRLLAGYPEQPLLPPRLRRQWRQWQRDAPAGSGKLGVPAGAAQPAAGGVRDGVGHVHDRRAQGVLRDGAGEDGGDMDGGGHGARAPRRGGHRRVPARRRQEGGEGVRRGVPLREVPGGRDRSALALQDPAGLAARGCGGGRRRWPETVLLRRW